MYLRLKYFLYTILLLFLYGCAAVGMVYPDTRSHDYSEDRASMVSKEQVLAGRANVGHDYLARALKQRPNAAQDTLYIRKIAWCGVVVVVIPLVLPVCADEEIFIFEDELLIKHVDKRVSFTGIRCAVLPIYKFRNGTNSFCDATVGE